MNDQAPDEGLTVELDTALEADAAPSPGADSAEDGERPAWLEAHMSGYQKQRQNVYDRTKHLLASGGPFSGGFDGHRWKETAKAEAGLVRAQAGVSRSRGGQLYWIQSLLRFDGAARAGYASKVDLVAGMMDVHRATAKNLVYLAARVGEGTVKRHPQGSAVVCGGAGRNPPPGSRRHPRTDPSNPTSGFGEGEAVLAETPADDPHRREAHLRRPVHFVSAVAGRRPLPGGGATGRL